MKTFSKKLVSAGAVAAIAASLCCITPVLAFVAGIGGIASAFSWLEPVRPYFIGMTILALGFAWYQKLRPSKIDCACEDEEKPSFTQSKKFLGMITIFAAVALAFPYYANAFYPQTKARVDNISPQNMRQIDLDIAGMTCSGCEEHVKHAVALIPGFIEASADYKTGKASVTFDVSRTTAEQIMEAVNESGYKVTDHKLLQN